MKLVNDKGHLVVKVSQSKFKTLYPNVYADIISKNISCDTWNDIVWHYANNMQGYFLCKNPACSNPIRARLYEPRYCSTLCRSRDPEWKIKVAKTANSNGGVGLARESIRLKVAKTTMARYGVSNIFDLDRKANTKKACETRLERYGYRWHQQSKLKNLEDLSNTEFVQSLIDKGWIYVAKHFGLSENSHSSAIKFIRANGYKFTKHGNSILENDLADFIESIYSGEIIINGRSCIAPYELDIYIPEFNLAIEFDGLYWHSAGSKEEERPKYHLLKTELCEEKGIHLLHIFENEWNDPVKRELWKSVIAHKLGKSKRIYARKCKLLEIPSKEANEFIKNNHLQGSCTSASISLGLYFDNKLVQVATFGKPRYSKGYDYELLRLCSLKGHAVIGGASKLLSSVTGSIVSYANRRWSYGNVYDKLGLTKHSVTGPCYFYIVSGQLFHRSSYMKHKLSTKLGNFDPSKTEVENCYANGLRRIWDCGNIVYRRV